MTVTMLILLLIIISSEYGLFYLVILYIIVWINLLMQESENISVASVKAARNLFDELVHIDSHWISI